MDNKLEITLGGNGGRWKMQYDEKTYGNAIELDDGVEPEANALFELLVTNFVDSYRVISGHPLSNVEDMKQVHKILSGL